MTKKNFGAKLSKTVAASDTAMEERMSKLDKIFATTPAAEVQVVVPPTPTAGPEQDRPEYDLVAPSRPVSSKPQASSSKVVRDNFSMPEDDYAIINELRSVAARAGRTETTKSSVLRAGLHALRKMSPEELLQVLKETERVKPGRKIESTPN